MPFCSSNFNQLCQRFSEVCWILTAISFILHENEYCKQMHKSKCYMKAFYSMHTFILCQKLTLDINKIASMRFCSCFLSSSNSFSSSSKSAPDSFIISTTVVRFKVSSFPSVKALRYNWYSRSAKTGCLFLSSGLGSSSWVSSDSDEGAFPKNRKYRSVPNITKARNFSASLDISEV